MKKIVTLTFTLSLALHVFGQLDFLPLGSTRYLKSWCLDGDAPNYSQNTVTVDSIIAGKYCTRIFTEQWVCSMDEGFWVFVYQEDGRVYRWEHSTSTFHLVLDYSKQTGESWKIGICGDSVTITVLGIQGIHRVVSMLGDANTTWDFPELDLYEGFGGIVNNPLLFSLGLFIEATPPCYRQVLCYEDPVLGIVYSGWESCISATENLEDMGDVMSIYPNPGIDVVTFKTNLPAWSKETFSIYDLSGRLMSQWELQIGMQEHLFSVANLPNGIYLWQWSQEGQTRQQGKIIVSK